MWRGQYEITDAANFLLPSSLVKELLFTFSLVFPLNGEPPENGSNIIFNFSKLFTTLHNNHQQFVTNYTLINTVKSF